MLIQVTGNTQGFNEVFTHENVVSEYEVEQQLHNMKTGFGTPAVPWERSELGKPQALQKLHLVGETFTLLLN